jgi:branched-chain amino acid transport system ATP-binding protein
MSLLELRGVTASYGPIVAVRDLSLRVEEGEAVCLIGANGAGKTTTLKTIAGLLPPRSGQITFQDEQLAGLRTAAIARRGVALVPEGREMLSNLTVAENLVAGTFAAAGRPEGARPESGFDHLYEMFPVLGRRRRQRASTLSGGEQQMLAIARALAGRPKLLMLDEPSMGLAPLVVRALFEQIGVIVESGVTVLLVEQNARMALSMTQRGYVMAGGAIVTEGTVEQLRQDEKVMEAYLGSRDDDAVH